MVETFAARSSGAPARLVKILSKGLEETGGMGGIGGNLGGIGGNLGGGMGDEMGGGMEGGMEGGIGEGGMLGNFQYRIVEKISD